MVAVKLFNVKSQLKVMGDAGSVLIRSVPIILAGLDFVSPYPYLSTIQTEQGRAEQSRHRAASQGRNNRPTDDVAIAAA